MKVRYYIFGLIVYLVYCSITGNSITIVNGLAQNSPKGSTTTGGTTGGGADANFRSKAEVNTTATGNSTVAEPASAAANDVFWALAICDAAGSITLPAGWTSLYNGTAGGNFDYNLAWIRRGGSAPSLTWVIGGTSIYREIHVLAYSGVVTVGNPYEASADGGVVTTTTPDAPSVTTVNANSRVIAWAISWAGITSTPTVPAGYTHRTRNSVGVDDIVAADILKVVAGSENPAAWGPNFGSATTWTATTALQD